MKKIICTIFLIIITLLSLKSILLNSSIYEAHKEESNASTLSKYDSLEFEYAFEGALSQYDIVDISSSFNFTLILTTTGEVYGFGHNFRGQLGDGTTESSSIPIKVVDNPESGFVNKGVTAISAGGYNSLILKDGVVYSFGWNRYGELGDGTIDLKSKPVKVNL